jgi:hypothetical protein
MLCDNEPKKFHKLHVLVGVGKSFAVIIGFRVCLNEDFTGEIEFRMQMKGKNL